MISFKKSRFVTSSPSIFQGPMDKPSIMMVGRSNVGKSTLINGILGQKIAFASKKAGKTKLLNYFDVDDTFYLVDSPGYGSTNFATMSTIQFANMMEEAVKCTTLRGLCVLLDLRREPGKDDVAFLKWLAGSGKEMIVVLTKCDQMNQSALHKARTMAKELGFDLIIESDLSSKAITKVQNALASVYKK